MNSRDREYWNQRIKKFGEAGVGYGGNERLVRWDNIPRAKAISRLVTVKPGMKVLDVGTGSGYWAIRCAQAGATVVGVDFVDSLLEIAAARAKEAGVEIQWLQGSIEDLNLAEGSYDLILSITCLECITDKERQVAAIQRILQLLKDGGIFLLLEDTSRKEIPYLRRYTQRGWIELIESQGAKLVDFTAVNFFRFPLPRGMLAPFWVGLDISLASIPWLKKLAMISAFAFTVRK